MQDSENTILPDHQDRLEEKFEHIAYLIDNSMPEDAGKHLLELHHADLADFLDNANSRIYEIIFPIIAEKINPQTIVSLNDSTKQPVIEAIGVKVSSILINQLEIDDAIEVIDNLDQELKDLLLTRLEADKKKQILEGFTYPEDTAGRVMEKNFVSLQEHWNCGQAVDYIKRSNISQDFHAAIIIDKQFRPVGNISISTLITNPHSTKLSSLMNSEFKVATTSTELDELAFIFKQYTLSIVPVVNKQGRLVGSISIDNMLYIVEEQAESEFMHLGGINNSDIFDNLYVTVRHRFSWLFINLVTACLTSIIINQFSETIAKLITLATIMPIVASVGGNAGTQAMTVTIRALANREFINVNTMKVILKEIIVCALNGLLLAVIGGALTYALFSDSSLSIIFAVAVIINFTVAGYLGSAIPIILSNMDIDPATASGVLLTGLTDAIGFFSFLGLAYYFLV